MTKRCENDNDAITDAKKNQENCNQLVGLREKITGTSHSLWENLWFRVDFPLSQPIDISYSKGLRFWTTQRAVART